MPLDNASSSCSCDSDSLTSTVRAMNDRETTYRTADYLQHPARLSCESPVDAECRAQMIDWCLQIANRCELKRETVAVASNILDRFLYKSPWALVDRSAFQLASITSFYTAIKLHEPQVLDVQTMSNLSRHVYTSEQIEAMERVILEATQWLVNPPTVYLFGHMFCELVVCAYDKVDHDALIELTNMQLETALSDYQLSLVPASSVAMAAVVNAIDSMAICSPHELQEVECFLASQANIQGTTCQLRDIQIRLYEGMAGDKALSTHPVGHDYTSRPGSPTSVRHESALSHIDVCKTC